MLACAIISLYLQVYSTRGPGHDRHCGDDRRRPRQETETMRFEGIHHVTCITGDAPRERRLLRPRPRPPAREEDGQPGRPDRLPPLLRGRGGQRRAPTSPSSSTRARAAGARGTGWCTPSSFRVGLRGRARLLGGAPGRRGRRDATRRAGRLGFEDPEGLGLELSSSTVATSRSSPRIRRSRPSTRSRGSTASARSRSTRSAAARCSRA